MNVIVADYYGCTALGPDLATAWPRLLAGDSAVRPNARLAGRTAGLPWPSAVCEGVGYGASSLMMQLLAGPLAALHGRLPANTLLLLATTIGEIDRLEDAQLSGKDDPTAGRLDGLLHAVSAQLGLSRPGCIVSCACASSSMAMALGAGLIRTGRETDVVVVACDAVSEFVLAGFSSLAALSPEPARPFDRHRQGLSLGEAAGWCWLRAGQPGASDVARGRLLGWSCRADAYHMTAPVPPGDGLVAAVKHALDMSCLDASEVAAFCAHGTGTRYNDDMELRAFETLSKRPVFSIKGSLGHTLGAAGLIEAAISLEASRDGWAPPTTGCQEPDPADAPVTRMRTRLSGTSVVSTNSGFGGVNTALVLDARPEKAIDDGGQTAGRAALLALGWASSDELGLVHTGGVNRVPLPAQDNPEPFFRGGYKNWGRVSGLARRLACTIEFVFQHLGIPAPPGPARTCGILGMNAYGCHEENQAFFRDYLDNGRSLARGGLFVYTLPSTPVAEASIRFGLRGPVGHLADPGADFSRAVEWGCSIMDSGDADGMIIAGLQSDRVLCAFLAIQHTPGLGWAEDLARAMPGAGAEAWANLQSTLTL